MILTFLIDLFGNFLTYIVNLLPVGALPTGLSTALLSVLGYLYAFSFILPVDQILVVLVFALTFHLAILGFKLFHWMFGKLRGSN